MINSSSRAPLIRRGADSPGQPRQFPQIARQDDQSGRPANDGLQQHAAGAGIKISHHDKHGGQPFRQLAKAPLSGDRSAATRPAVGSRPHHIPAGRTTTAKGAGSSRPTRGLCCGFLFPGHWSQMATRGPRTPSARSSSTLVPTRLSLVERRRTTIVAVSRSSATPLPEEFPPPTRPRSFARLRCPFARSCHLLTLSMREMFRRFPGIAPKPPNGIGSCGGGGPVSRAETLCVPIG